MSIVIYSSKCSFNETSLHGMYSWTRIFLKVKVGERGREVNIIVCEGAYLQFLLKDLIIALN